MLEIKNAKIVSTNLGFEDHGIFTAHIRLAGDGWGVTVGGYSLDGPTFGSQEMAEKCAGFIPEILRVVGVDKWEDLPGKYIRIESERIGPVSKIGNITEDKWLDFDEYFKK